MKILQWFRKIFASSPDYVDPVMLEIAKRDAAIAKREAALRGAQPRAALPGTIEIRTTEFNISTEPK